VNFSEFFGKSKLGARALRMVRHRGKQRVGMGGSEAASSESGSPEVAMAKMKTRAKVTISQEAKFQSRVGSIQFEVRSSRRAEQLITLDTRGVQHVIPRQRSAQLAATFKAKLFIIGP